MTSNASRGPRSGASEPAVPAPACPFCGSEETELMSLFGTSALTSQYYCRGCRTVFESVKWGTLTGGADGGPGRPG